MVEPVLGDPSEEYPDPSTRTGRRGGLLKASLRWRLVGNVRFVTGCWLLLLAVPVGAVVAAPGYVVGRLAAHVVLYAVC